MGGAGRVSRDPQPHRAGSEQESVASSRPPGARRTHTWSREKREHKPSAAKEERGTAWHTARWQPTERNKSLRPKTSCRFLAEPGRRAGGAAGAGLWEGPRWWPASRVTQAEGQGERCPPRLSGSRFKHLLLGRPFERAVCPLTQITSVLTMT